MLRKAKSAKKRKHSCVSGCAGVCNFYFSLEGKASAFLWPVEFLGFLENARNPKYPNLQASVEKHAIRQLCMYIRRKNSNMDLFEGLIGEFEEPCTPYQKQPPSTDGGI